MEECFVFTHRGNFQALKVRDLKLSYASQLCDLNTEFLLAFYKSNSQMQVFWSQCRALPRKPKEIEAVNITRFGIRTSLRNNIPNIVMTYQPIKMDHFTTKI